MPACSPKARCFTSTCPVTARSLRRSLARLRALTSAVDCGYPIGVTNTSPVTYTSQIPDIDTSCHDDQIVPNFFGLETLNSYIRDFLGLELKKLTL